MRLSDSQARAVSRSVVISAEMSADLLAQMLGRYLTEDEIREFERVFGDKLFESLTEMEFEDPEQVPKIDSVQVWADDHKGFSYRRPHGKVLYTVIGEVGNFIHGAVRRNVPLVSRSSDGKIQVMSINELEGMTRV